MISIKNYAANKGVTPQSIYQHIKRYKSDLEPHIIKENGIKNLDDFAVKFLDDKIEGDTIVILDTQKDEEIKKLQNENKILLLKLAEVQEKALSQSDMIIDLQTKMIESKSRKKWFFQKNT
jgi:hypothetical protein